MKKIFLTLFIALSIMYVRAQVNTGQEELRRQMTELTEIKDPTILENRLKALSQSGNENERLIAYSYYSRNNNREKAEQIKKQIIDAFPKGRFAGQARQIEIARVNDLDEQERLFNEFMREYEDPQPGLLAYELATGYARKGNEVKMKIYGELYSKYAFNGQGKKVSVDQVYNMLASYMAESNPDAAIPYLQRSLIEEKKELDSIKSLSDVAPNQFLKVTSSYSNSATAYIKALIAKGNENDGYQLAKEVYTYLNEDPKSDERVKALFEQTYVNTLLATNRFAEALPYMEKAVRGGTASQNIKNNLKKAYNAVYGSEIGYEAYEEGLKVESQKKLREEVASLAIDQPSHNFTLKDVNGKSISLNDLKGKVVILDFWATWCGPCKASFPYMQQAVDKYRNDPNVKFLFLHTWERGAADATLEAKKYVDDNEYTFEVLMDLRDPATKQSAVATAYKVDGIPTKIIIDPKGRIRFNTSGFSQDAEKAVQELSAMIEYAREK